MLPKQPKLTSRINFLPFYTRKHVQRGFVSFNLTKSTSTMGFQTNISSGLIFPDHTTPGESDSELVISTIPTNNRNKPSTIDRVGPVIDNAGFQLVTHRGNTQPKLKSIANAPPRPIRYPEGQSQYQTNAPKTEKKLIQTFLNFPVKKASAKQA